MTSSDNAMLKAKWSTKYPNREPLTDEEIKAFNSWMYSVHRTNQGECVHGRAAGWCAGCNGNLDLDRYNDFFLLGEL
jgi:hypothetical protein